MSWAIETSALSKHYSPPQGLLKKFSKVRRGVHALNNLDLQVRRGELFGLLGPNGAGKTTLIKTLTTLIVPTSGTALVNGFPLTQETAIKASVGLVTGDERSFYWRLSGRENLIYFAQLHGLSSKTIRERVQSVLKAVDLERAADNRFQTYSTGMRQRLSIARSLLHEPKILFLDEPTRGLDPTAARQLRRLMRESLVNQQGITVFLTTHHLEEAEELCDRVAVIHRGCLRGCGSLAELRAELKLPEIYHFELGLFPSDCLAAFTATMPGLQMVSDRKNGNNVISLEITTNGQAPDEVLSTVVDTVRQQGGVIRAIERKQASLETVFDRLVNEGALHPIPSQNTEFPQPHPAFSSPKISSDHHPSSFRIAWATLKRDFREEASYPLSFFLQFISIFFSASIFFFLSRLLGSAVSPYLQSYGGDYFAFVLIGIAFSGYFNVGLSGFSSSLRRAQTTGTLEAMLGTPAGLSALILSSSLWSYLVTTLRVFVFLFLGAAFLGVNLGNGNYPLALFILILTVVAFNSLGIIAASFIMVLKRGDPITWIFGSLASLLGGVYYPIAVLPPVLQLMARLIPVTYSLEAMRLALLQGATFTRLLPELLTLMAFCLVLLPASLLTFRWAVRRARIDGSLTHF